MRLGVGDGRGGRRQSWARRDAGDAGGATPEMQVNFFLLAADSRCGSSSFC